MQPQQGLPAPLKETEPSTDAESSVDTESSTKDMTDVPAGPAEKGVDTQQMEQHPGVDSDSDDETKGGYVQMHGNSL